MQKIRILLLEDNVEDVAIITATLNGMGYEMAGIASDFDEAMSLFQSTQPDIAILDIFTKGAMEGIKFGHWLNDSQSANIPFIYLTSAKDKLIFVEAKRSKPNGFLIKPFNPLELDYAIELALENFSDASGEINEGRITIINKSFYVKHNKSLIKHDVDSISYIQVSGRYCELHVDGQRFLCRKSLSELANIFPEGSLIRTHRNYAINPAFVKKIVASENSVYLTDGTIVPVSAKHMEEVKNLFPTLV